MTRQWWDKQRAAAILSVVKRRISCRNILSHDSRSMICTFLATYPVDFVPPRKPGDIDARTFADTLSTILLEADVLQRTSTSSIDPEGVTIASTKAVAYRDVSSRVREYNVRHVVRFDRPLSRHAAALDPANRLRAYLVEALGLHPRQSEGPFNIIGLTLRVEKSVADDTDVVPHG